MRVHVICTCLSSEMANSSLLVFKSIRVGFPKAELVVYSNALPSDVDYSLKSGCALKLQTPVLAINQLISHDTWVETLINTQNEPFWICDTDCVFYDSVEGFKAELFGGRFEPQFHEEWTDSIHMARLHPSVMYIDPVAIRCAVREWRGRHIPKYFPNAIASLIRQQFLCRDGKTLFYDTCSGLHHAFGGTAFPDEINSRFEHLHAGTYADTISAETESLSGLVDLHRRVCNNPDAARGILAGQVEYYKSRANGD